MTNTPLIFLLFIVLVLSGCRNVRRSNWEEWPEFGQYFAEAGVEGAFVLYDLKEDHYFAYNVERLNTPFIPASTYKIFNSLVALETGVIEDENQIIKWDGVERGLAVWNQDHSLRTAIKHSTVWFYQELARRIGRQQMQHYVDLAGYGNQDISGEIDLFWLEGELRITPRQQVDFLVRLYRNELPFSAKNQEIVKDILLFEQTEDHLLRAKTGWGMRFTPEVGWFVGYWEHNENVYFFALNIDIVAAEDGEARIEITKQIMRAWGEKR